MNLIKDKKMGKKKGQYICNIANLDEEEPMEQPKVNWAEEAKKKSA